MPRNYTNGKSDKALIGHIGFAYVIFALFVILYSLSGERGNWIYDLLVLIWMHHKYYKKINFMKILKLSIVAFVSLYIVAAIVDLRQGLAVLAILTVVPLCSRGHT